MTSSRKQRVGAKEPLPPPLDNMLEELAERFHEFWAEQRRAEGWTYGKKWIDQAEEMAKS